ncbi:class I SAM-dependent methyltransferase [Candidatus Pacearchaeota archaeon]|jgi:hypothetical protein|nr:class I SAM-dependent methyltransferase [Candidatus Pacearchaeota archaeon]
MDLFETEYAKACAQESDINEHLPYLHGLAINRLHVTEFGVRQGTSTRAFMAARPKRLVSYDLVLDPVVGALFERAVLEGHNYAYRQANVLDIEIEETDILFIDTFHTGRQVTAELARHGGKVRDYIIFHDVETFGWVGEDGSEGILRPIIAFMAADHDWTVFHYDRANNGLLTIARGASTALMKRDTSTRSQISK